MSFHPHFADWYRLAGVTLLDGILEKRWAGIKAVVEKPAAHLVLDLAKLFVLQNATDALVPPEFRAPFSDRDDSFPSRDNLLELRVLAGAALHLIIEQGGPHSNLAALALTCGSFGPRESVLLEAEHLEVAERFLVKRSRDLHQTANLANTKVPHFTKEKLTERLPLSIFATNQTGPIHEPLLSQLAEIASGFSTALDQATAAITQLSHTVNVRGEEIDVLWWLQNAFSRDIQKSFSEIGYRAAALILPMEVADLTFFVPGPINVVAVLVHALQLSGASSSAEEVSLAESTNACAKEWREAVRARQDFGAVGLLTPVLLGIQKSLETDGQEDWFPVYRKACDVPVDKRYPILKIAIQMYRERMLLRAVEEAQRE